MSAIHQLVSAVSHLRASAYTTGAGGTVLLYDILLTLEDEKRLIWPSRFSLVKLLYFIVRIMQWFSLHVITVRNQNRYFPVPCLLLGMYRQ
jgi:hypothetical protein